MCLVFEFAAPQAAGIIHSDFEKGFIVADVTKVDDFIALGSEEACKIAGKTTTQGKDYIVAGACMHLYRTCSWLSALSSHVACLYSFLFAATQMATSCSSSLENKATVNHLSVPQVAMRPAHWFMQG